jgi:hypothetical protein
MTMAKKNICISIDPALLQEFTDLQTKLGLTLNKSEEIERGFRIRLEQLKAKFSFQKPTSPRS